MEEITIEDLDGVETQRIGAEESEEASSPELVKPPEKVEQTASKDGPVMFRVNRAIYILRFNMNIIDTIERNFCPDSSFNALLSNLRLSGSFSISVLRNLFIMALRETNSNKTIDSKKANKIFEHILMRDGGPGLTEIIIDQLSRDCPFLFKA